MEPIIYTVSEKTSLVIQTLFENDIDVITKETIQQALQDSDSLSMLTEPVIDELQLIVKMKQDKKKDYRIILSDVSVPEPSETTEEDTTLSADVYEDTKKEYILPHRKAYVDWLNHVFYKQVMKNEPNSPLNFYQKFVKYYLGINTPYRGLLVYHGLGTGKTATAISTAEGLSNSMPIRTLLPASLETEFIKEVKLWGDDMFRIQHQNWVFLSLQNLQEDATLKQSIRERTHLTFEKIKFIHRRVKKITQSKSLVPGVWITTQDRETYESQIKTMPNKEGKSFLRKNEETTQTPCLSLTQEDIVYIEEQTTVQIKQKYNFIHYNPLPPLDISKKDSYTDNERITIQLKKKLAKNIKKDILSPFHDEVLIIDEVHNFVRQIYNKRGVSKQYYEWIVNAPSLKLVFLSGTPIINRPSEIAFLMNMLKGAVDVYTFVIQDTIKRSDVEDLLRNEFYHELTPVDQFFIQKERGKLLVSFTKNKTTFESVRNETSDIIYTVQYKEYDTMKFIEYVYKKLSTLFDSSSILPSMSQIKKDKSALLRKKPIVYDKDTNRIFLVSQYLFEIRKKDNTTIDLTDNDAFMDYFFNRDTNLLEPDKRILLKRMLMGLVSYYPIDRSAVKTMPEVVKPLNLPMYQSYDILKTIKLVPCYFSYKQFLKYKDVWKIEKDKAIQKSIYHQEESADDNFDYHIRTRQACNMIYENDDFRTLQKTNANQVVIESRKEKEYELLTESGVLDYSRGLQILSPKFYEIMKNIQSYMKEGTPTGKILFYSEFRADAGAEIFEKVLQANGYTNYDGSDDITNAKRYTFITGQEDEKTRKKNKDAFNRESNKYGTQIQILLISSAGAEGISLKGVRQVHILEPYWNYVRIDQVFGRAIRINSHKELDPSERTVEKFLYVSMFPEGTTIESVYQFLRTQDNWKVPEIETDIVNSLYTNHKETYAQIQEIIELKTNTRQKTIDQSLVDTMEKKYKISQEIISVIQESSVDCIQNTRDSVILNENCIRFDKKLTSEDSYFPGIESTDLQKIDKTQLTSTFSYHIHPDIYVFALDENPTRFAYYRIAKQSQPDIRYIRENGYLLGILDTTLQMYYDFNVDVYTSEDETLGTKFSLYQSLFRLTQDQMKTIQINQVFPKPQAIKQLQGWKVKHASSDMFFYLDSTNNPITRLYNYELSEQSNFQLQEIPYFVVDNNTLYKIST